MSRPRLIALMLALATLVVFLPVGRYQFVNFDDTDYVTDNPFVKNGLNWTDLRWAFTTFHASNWHPLTWVSHQADCEFFGLDAGAHHFVNLLLHAANTALLFLLIWRLTDRLWPSMMIAALFAWHPLHVESVAWISERKDVLSAFFALLSLSSYVKFGRDHSRWSFWFAWLFFTLGLLAKPMLVTLPCIFILLDFWPLGRFHGISAAAEKSRPKYFTSLVVEKWPFFALVVMSCVVTFLAQKIGGAVVSLNHVPFHYRVENAPIAVVRYIFKLFWPAELSPIYLLGRIYWWQAIVCCVVLGLVSAAAWRWRRSKPFLIVGWLWFLGMLIPVIGLVQVGSQAIADRYTYLPSIGFFLAVVLLADEGLARLETPKLIISAVCGVVLAACIVVTEFQLPNWQNSETLFRHAIALNPRNIVALINLGVMLQEEGRFDEAEAAYRQGEKFEDGPYYQLHDNYGDLLDKLGRHGEALAEYGKAIHENPADVFAHNAAGSEFAALGYPDKAFREFSAAEQLDPHYAWPHVETAQLLLKLGRDTEAVNELHTAVQMSPNDASLLALTAHILAANEDAAARDGKTALLLAARANDLAGHAQPMIFDAMGMACAELGDFTNAAACAQNALELAAELHMTNTAALEERLRLYQNHQPWRESFRATNTPAGN